MYLCYHFLVTFTTVTEPYRPLRAITIWLTGLPGSGKTTLASVLAEELHRKSVVVRIIDGDSIRQSVSKDLGFSKEDRDTNVRRIGIISNVLNRNGVTVIVAAISPYRTTRDEVRAIQKSTFIEVFVECPIEVLIRRDPKGLYKKALTGELQNFSGISDPYEPPLHPEIIVRTDICSSKQCATRIIKWLTRRGFITGNAPESRV